MIGYINGLIIDKEEKSLIVLAGSIGYKVLTTSDLISTSALENKVQLFIHTVVREDDISLYGFEKKDELQFFEKLISVSGIGPKMALEILSTPVHMVKNAIVGSDVAFLTKIKGLGKKTAERLILELKNKIDHISEADGSMTASNEDAISALEGLGYERFSVIKAMVKLPKEVKETEDIVKYFLKNN